MSALMDAVEDAGTHTMLIAGEAGIGKSRLVGEFTRRLDPRALVLVGRCPEFGTGGVAFAPFLAVLRTLARQVGVAEIATLLPPRPAVANWLPQLAAHTGGAGDSDRVRLFGETLTLLEQLATNRRVVLVLEDLHWADDASRELLTFLVANLAEGNVLLVGTYRPGDAGSLRALLAEVRRNPGVRALTLEPLTRHEVGRQLAALLGREPEPALITMAFQRSGGNPLFVEALRESPGAPPEELTELLLGFLTGVTGDGRAVLRVAAVLGSPIRHELLTAGADVGEDALRTALRELVDRRLLSTTEMGYEFRHVLIRQAVYNDLLPVERAALHARIAEVLRGEQGAQESPAELAHHAEAAGQSAEALSAYLSAAERAGVVAAERVRVLDRAVLLWDRVAEPERPTTVTKIDVLERILDAAIEGGTVERGIAAADAAIEIATAGAASGVEATRLARWYRQRALLRGGTGLGPGDDLARALALLQDATPTLERAEVLAQSAVVRIFGGDTEGTVDDARAALAVAQRFGASAVAARAHGCLGLASADRIDTASEHFADAHTAAAECGDPRVLLDVLTWESAVLVAAGRYRAAITAAQRGLRTAHEALRFAESAPILLVKWVQASAALGEWDEAGTLVDEAELQQVPPLSRAALRLCLGRIDLARGQVDAARAGAEVAERLLGDARWAFQYRLELRTLQCLLALETGDNDTAARILIDIVAADDAIATLTAHPHESWPLLVVAVDVPGAPAELIELAEALPATYSADAAHRADFRARSAPSAERWQLAAAAWHDLERPFEEARSLFGVAECRAAEGDREAAGSALRALMDLAAPLGAVPLTAAATQLAARARISLDPDSPETTPPTPSFGLTPRELEVLRLVSKGLSNRALAAELFISANTAGVHVSRILTKLSVATRTEAAAFAHDHHLLTN